MKHGGHSDLIELVSLAKIEREMGVRSKWKIDRLSTKRDGKDRDKSSRHSQQRQGQNDQCAQRHPQPFSFSSILVRVRSALSLPRHVSASSLTAAHFLKPSSSSSSSRSSSVHRHHHRQKHEQKQQLHEDDMKRLSSPNTFFVGRNRPRTGTSSASTSRSSSAHYSKSVMTSESSSRHLNVDEDTKFNALSPAHFLKPSSSPSSSRHCKDGTYDMLKPLSSPLSPPVHQLDMDKKKKKSHSLHDAHFLKPSSPSFHSVDDNNRYFHANEQTKDGSQHEQQQREEEILAIQHAVEDMKRRIPAFRMIFISPMHVRERSEELKNRSFATSFAAKSSVLGRTFDLQKMREELMSSSSSSSSLCEKKPATADGDDRDKLITRTEAQVSSSFLPSGVAGKLACSNTSVSRTGRALHIFSSPYTKDSSIHVKRDHVDLCFGGSFFFCKETSGARSGEMNKEEERAGVKIQSPGLDGRDGYASLIAFVDNLRQKQELNEWKITLAQQKIGLSGSDDDSQSPSKTAAYLLAKGMLHGPLLHHLIDSEIQVIRNLQLLTMPEEADVVDQVRAEYRDIMSRLQNGNCQVSAATVSTATNNYVGKAIHKNFDPIKGRFVKLKQFGIDLRNGHIHLMPKEVVPAKHLENLFYHLNFEIDVDGCNIDGNKIISGDELISSTFDMSYTSSDDGDNMKASHHSHPIFASGLDQWQSLLGLSLSARHPNATRRIWTCGLTDGGLHNMFLSENYMWLFDLGEPGLEPIPAFLTKFLMSFFHTLGMEEDEKGDWIVRFVQDDLGKLKLTKETMDILPTVMRAFNTTVDRLIKEVFGDEEEIRVLLLRYVVTQLISDAAFCLEKWRIKGGGDELRSGHQDNLEKWLWRALWDVYISEEVRRRYLTRMLFRRQFESRDLSSISNF